MSGAREEQCKLRAVTRLFVDGGGLPRAVAPPTRSVWRTVHEGAAGRARERAVRIPGLHRQRCRSDRGTRGWRAVEVEHILEIAGVRIPGGETRQREALLQERQDRGMRADGV